MWKRKKFDLYDPETWDKKKLAQVDALLWERYRNDEVLQNDPKSQAVLARLEAGPIGSKYGIQFAKKFLTLLIDQSTLEGNKEIVMEKFLERLNTLR